MKRIPEVKVVPLDLRARDHAGDAGLVEELVARMAEDGWTFVSLAATTGQTALVVFTRPPKRE